MTELAENGLKLAENVAADPSSTQNNQHQSTDESTLVPSTRCKLEHVLPPLTLKQPRKLTPDPPQSASISPQPTGPFLIRPPLSRSDSRQNFQYRPPFPPSNHPPQSISPHPPNYQPPSPVNSGPQSILGSTRPPTNRSPTGAPQGFAQRAPLAPRSPQQGNTPVSFNQNLQQRPLFRPQSPFRPPLLGQRPQVFQQNSVPTFNRPRPTLEESFTRSQTLDSAELEHQKHGEEQIQRPPSAASLDRSYSMTSSNPGLERKLTSSQESINISRQSSMENVNRKEEFAAPKPESRPGSRMGRIMEDQDKKISESRGEIINGDHPPKSPLKSKPPSREEPRDEPQIKDMELKFVAKGDNDSGVDESTQGNDQSCNGDSRSPRKPNKSRTSSTTPTKGRSLSRGSKTPSSLQSPDSAATTPGSAEKKKVPMNKIQVGSAPSPNLKVVKSKIGSLDNAHYKPGGGKVKIESKKLDFKNAGPRIEAKNDKYMPKGGEKKDIYSARSAVNSASPRKIITQKLEWNAKSKIGSLENAAHKPKGGDKKIESVKFNFKDKATAKIGSKDNIKHQPGGGNVKIENKKIELHATSKVGSMDNVKHKPAGGDKKIFDDKDFLKQHKSGKSSLDQSLSGSQQSVQSQEPKAPVADENLNREH